MASPAISPNNGQPVPPSGYKVDVNPPAGYVLDTPDYSDVPAFLQSGLDMSKVRQVVVPPQTDLDRNSIAKVSDDGPYRVQVLSPDLYGPPILNHELTHTYQETRNKDLPGVSAPVTQSGRAAYDYGGVQGLRTAQANRMTVSNFNDEQQAEMVKDYKALQDEYLQKAAQGKITPIDLKHIYAIHEAYHPFIQQLADMPGAEVNLDRSPLLELLGVQKPVDITGAPKPPGLPPYDTPGLGVLPADPLMGGKSQPTKTESKQLPSQVLQEVFDRYPGLAKTLNKSNTEVVFADPKRSQRGLKERGGLEFWNQGDKGPDDYPSPNPSKNVLEIYSNELKRNPNLLKQAIYGDLMHGMSNDPYWKGLRTEFMKNFTPEELKRQEQHKAWSDDVNNTPISDRFGPTYDAYIRGYLTNQDFKYGEYTDTGQKELGNTEYSPKQIELLQKMHDYLKNGKVPSDKGDRKQVESKEEEDSPPAFVENVDPKDYPPQKKETTKNVFDRNLPYAKPGPWLTKLSPPEEKKFDTWWKSIKATHPYLDSPDDPNSGYDYRGWFHAALTGDPDAKIVIDPVDHLPHWTDTYKTPYHNTFNKNSKYATDDAPRWTRDFSQLVDKKGKVIFYNPSYIEKKEPPKKQ